MAISDEFEDELKKLAKKLERDEKRRVEHSCSLCMGQECGLCGEKCLKLEPVRVLFSNVLQFFRPHAMLLRELKIFFFFHHHCLRLIPVSLSLHLSHNRSCSCARAPVTSA